MSVAPPPPPSWIRKLVSVRVRLLPMVIFCAVVLLSVKIVSFWDFFKAPVMVALTHATEDTKGKDQKASGDTSGGLSGDTKEKQQEQKNLKASPPDLSKTDSTYVSSASNASKTNGDSGFQGNAPPSDTALLSSPSSPTLTHNSASGADAGVETRAGAHAGPKTTAEAPTKVGAASGANSSAPHKDTTQKTFDPLDLTASEVKVLQELAQRRDQMVLREKELHAKESTLKAVEARLDAKLNELKDVKEKIEQAFDKDDERQKIKLDKLVKLYEGMKPKDAAKIMQDLHLEVSVRILEQMKEKSGSLILAKMDPETARFITVKLAERRRLAQIVGAEEQKDTGQ